MKLTLREISVAVVWAGLLLLLAIAAPNFFKPQQIRAVLVTNAPVLVAAIGMTLVIIARQIDISIGAQFCVCGLVGALAAQAGAPLPLIALVAVGLGALLGAINGWLVAGLRLPSIVVTLAMLVMLREGLRWLRGGENVRDLPETFQWLGLGQTVGSWTVVGTALVLCAIAAWGMSSLAAGRAVYAVGSDPEAARLVGIRPQRVIAGVFILMGALTGLAAFLNAIRFSDLDPNAGLGLELQVIAAVVVGGTAVSGGRGTMLGTLLGVGLLGNLGSALLFLGTQPEWEKALQGLIILAAVASERLRTKR